MANDSAPHAVDLEAMVPRQFRDNLSQAEKRMVSAAPKGEFAYCGPSDDDDDPANDPAKADDWDSGREIRAGLIRWLCVDQGASKRVDPHGVKIHAAKVTGELDLSSATVPFPLRLIRCRLAADIDFQFVRIPLLDLRGSSTGPLTLDGAEVRDNVFLNKRFSAVGEVRLLEARIGGSLECGGGAFKNLGGNALTADRAEVKGSVFLSSGFSAVGEVRLPGARIGVDLDCGDGTFKNASGIALFADGAEVRGTVFFVDGFSAVGEVRLVEAQIGGSLECEGGKFTALRLSRATVKAAFFWSDMRDGSSTRLDLKNASVGAIQDDVASWPERGRLVLDGFVYERIKAGPTDARTRLEWLQRQGEFRPQPYRQLAKVLREMGDDGGAKQVLFEMESRARAEDRRRLDHSVRWLLHAGEDVVSDATVGYGIYPGRAIWYLCGLTALGWIVHRRAQRVGAMAPTDKDAYAEFRKGQTPVHYQPSSPLIYSVENCVPLLKLGQDERWQPDPNQRRCVPPVAGGKFRRVVDSALDALVPDWAATPAALRWFRWIMIGLGWLLATFFVAGLTGIIKTS